MWTPIGPGGGNQWTASASPTIGHPATSSASCWPAAVRTLWAGQRSRRMLLLGTVRRALAARTSSSLSRLSHVVGRLEKRGLPARARVPAPAGAPSPP
ncbi:hypothetical protein [Actinoplanes sp. G11-F43]|uniref:hypothetical protein n=1 Tax=Actinoplanes sp. G11-F43 TaxID=3424130 RepID=UPI003D34979F